MRDDTVCTCPEEVVPGRGVHLADCPVYSKPGRVKVYVDWHDGWIGWYLSPDHLYVCFPLPFLVYRWSRKKRA